MEQNIKIKRDINMIRNIHPLKNHKMCRTKHNNFTFTMHCFLNIECLDAYFLSTLPSAIDRTCAKASSSATDVHTQALPQVHRTCIINKLKIV